MDKYKIQDIFGPKPLSDIQEHIWGIATHYTNYIEVFIPKSPILKAKPGYESIDEFPDIKQAKTSNENDIERSIRNTRKTLKGYFMCNKFDLFVTLTFKQDRYDIELLKTQVRNWIKNQIKRTGKFEYVLVPEYHKDGAIHFHGLFKDYKGILIQAIHPKTGKQIIKKGKKVYNLKSYSFGHTDVQRIDDSPDSSMKVGFYLFKYITKDMVNIFGKHRYFASHSLNTPDKEYNPLWFKNSQPIKEYPTEYGTIFTFNLEFKAENTTLL